MAPPVIGWESESPVPDQQFNTYLQSRAGKLHLDGVDLSRLFERALPGRSAPLGSPLEIVYLPKIRAQIAHMASCFERAKESNAYPGRFYYAYASKANAAEEVVRTALGTQAHYEISSTVDVDIVRRMKKRGLLANEKWIVSNGFKGPGTQYSSNLLRLKDEHPNLIPVLEDPSELAPVFESGKDFSLGLRLKTYGHHQSLEAMNAADSRFGMSQSDLESVADQIEAAPSLTWTMLHAMVGSQITDEVSFVERLTPAIEFFATLRQKHPDLHIFNFGGGVPVAMTLDLQFDYERFASLLMQRIQKICAGHSVPVADIMGEFGRYTVAEHGAHLFRVIAIKDNSSPLPWYLIDGSIMTSFPDIWALGEHFIVLPLNHLDRPFRRVRLGGITCDSDDIYPRRESEAVLYLPDVEPGELLIGFFGVGAYQEMLGGVGGSKHCVIPEADELIIDRRENGEYEFVVLEGQGADEVLQNLGYRI